MESDTHLCLLRPTADSNNLFNELLLLQLDRFLYSDLTKGVHRVFNAISHHACIVWLHTNLKSKTVGQSLHECWIDNNGINYWESVHAQWQTCTGNLDKYGRKVLHYKSGMSKYVCADIKIQYDLNLDEVTVPLCSLS